MHNVSSSFFLFLVSASLTCEMGRREIGAAHILIAHNNLEVAGQLAFDILFVASRLTKDEGICFS